MRAANLSMGATKHGTGRPDLMMHDITSAIASIDETNSLIYNTTQSPSNNPHMSKNTQKSTKNKARPSMSNMGMNQGVFSARNQSMLNHQPSANRTPGSRPDAVVHGKQIAGFHNKNSQLGIKVSGGGTQSSLNKTNSTFKGHNIR